MNTNNKIRLVFVVAGAILYQLFLKSFLFTFLGIGRTVQPISDFPYRCRRIHDPRLQACEDMWLSEQTRQLFLACSDPLARKYWMPNVNRLNASSRSLSDAVIALDLDEPNGDSFNYRVLKTTNFSGTNNDGRLYLIGITGKDTIKGDIRIYLNNARPSIDQLGGRVLDNVAADYTIESFTTSAKATKLAHKKSYRHPEIKSPNNIALARGGGFYITNDHGTARSGWRHEIAPYISNGDITHCTLDGTSCRVVQKGLAFPNGLMTGQDGLLYVPSTYKGNIHIFRPLPDHSLEKVGQIDVPYAIDNLSQDKKGDIWIAAIPKPFEILAAFEDPLHRTAPATALRARRKPGTDSEWQVDKILEDRDGEVLPGTTTAIHDAKTGRIFVSGVTAPFITVCEPK